MAVVLDASALLDGLLADARMASVNWAEVVQKSLSAGVNVEPFLPVDGERAGRQWPLTQQQGLSLGHPACLSLGSAAD